MDYKKIIKSRKTRLKILRLLSFIPDKPMLKIQYWIKTGRRLNLQNPERFTEKLQWYKLYYRNPRMIQCVDKYEVRSYITEKGLSDILVPIIGIYDNAEEICWDKLPESFVMKDTLGGGGSSVKIVKDKKEEDIDSLIQLAQTWVSKSIKTRGGGREWPYSAGKKHRIIIEEYVEAENKENGLVDYKFFCFDGKPEYLYVIAERKLSSSIKLGIFNMDFEQLEVRRNDELLLDKKLPKPANFEKMIEVASRLSEEFPEARVDLYNNNGKILFGEITFFDGSGYMTFTPDSFDYELGKNFELRKYLKSKGKEK